MPKELKTDLYNFLSELPKAPLNSGDVRKIVGALMTTPSLTFELAGFNENLVLPDLAMKIELAGTRKRRIEEAELTIKFLWSIYYNG